MAGTRALQDALFAEMKGRIKEDDASVPAPDGPYAYFRRYREGGASAIPGWRTDRGRIFIKYGAPDEILERKVQTGLMPYEIWKYTRQRNLKYVFMDLTRFGNYQLIYTDDRRERSRPDWQELLGVDGLRDLQENN